MDDLDIWSSPDPSHEAAQTADTQAASGSTAKKGLFDDDFNAPWGRDEEEVKEVEAPKEEPQTDLVAGLEDHKVEPEKTEVQPSSPKAASPAAPASGSDDGEDAFHEAGEVAGGEEDAEADADDGFGDFDDDANAPAAGGVDDDFGDFGDFPADGKAGNDDGFGDDDGFGEDAFGEEPAPQPQEPIPAAIATRADDWQSLSLQDTSYQNLSDQIQSILAPPTTSAGPSNPFGSGWSAQLGQDQIRQVEGPAQVLIGESSRNVYSTLSTSPALKPTDWLRSRTRRDLYISLGVPINLDELVDTSSSSSSARLPPLNIKLEDDGRRISRPASAAATASATAMETSSSSASHINGGDRERDKKRERERAMDKRREDLGLARPPDVDFKRLEEVCNLSEDQLTLLTLPSLQSLKRELETFTTQTSTLLTHHLTLRESLQTDSETYNGLIADLVAGAASRIGGNGKNVKRSSSVRMSNSASAKRSTFGGASASSTGRFGTPPPPNSASTANSTPRSGSPAPGSAGWRR